MVWSQLYSKKTAELKERAILGDAFQNNSALPWQKGCRNHIRNETDSRPLLGGVGLPTITATKKPVPLERPIPATQREKRTWNNWAHQYNYCMSWCKWNMERYYVIKMTLSLFYLWRLKTLTYSYIWCLCIEYNVISNVF